MSQIKKQTFIWSIIYLLFIGYCDINIIVCLGDRISKDVVPNRQVSNSNPEVFCNKFFAVIFRYFLA